MEKLYSNSIFNSFESTGILPTGKIFICSFNVTLHSNKYFFQFNIQAKEILPKFGSLIHSCVRITSTLPTLAQEVPLNPTFVLVLKSAYSITIKLRDALQLVKKTKEVGVYFQIKILIVFDSLQNVVGKNYMVF